MPFNHGRFADAALQFGIELLALGDALRKIS